MLKDSKATHKPKITISGIQKYLFWGLLFIVPFAIMPFPWDWTEKSMSLVILIISTVIVGLEILKLIWDGKVTLLKSVLDMGILITLLSMILSTLFSKDFNTSLWGVDGRMGSGLVTFIAILLVTISARTFIKSMGDVKKGLFALIMGVLVINILSILTFFGVNVWSFIPIYQDLSQAGLPILRSAKIHLLVNEVNLLLCLYFIINGIISTNRRKVVTVLAYIAGGFSILNIWLFSISQGFPLVIAFIVVILLFGIFGLKVLKLPQGEKKGVQILLILSGLLTIVPVVLLQFPAIRGVVIPSSINLVTQLSLGSDMSWVIASSTFIDSLWRGLFGLGPDTYTIAYNLYKPLSTSLLAYNDVNFYYAGNEIFTKFATGGLLWLASWIYLGYLVCKMFVEDVKKIGMYKEMEEKFLLLAIDITIAFIFISSIFVNYTVLIVLILFVLFTLQIVVKEVLSKGTLDKFVMKLWAVNLSADSESGKALSNINIFISIVTAFIFLGLTSIWVSKTISSVFLLKAESYYISQNALYIGNAMPTLDQKDTFIDSMSYYYSQASKYDGSDPLVSRKEGLMYLEKVGVAAERYTKEGDSNSSDIINNIGKWKNYSIDTTRKSIDMSPAIYANWEARARVYMGLVGMGFYDYATDSVYSLEKAMELNPLNFELYYSEAQINVISGKKDEALSSLTKVLGINPQHIPSMVLAAEINKEKGNTAVYESYLKAAKKVLETQGSTNSDIYQQITNQLNEISKPTTEETTQE